LTTFHLQNVTLQKGNRTILSELDWQINKGEHWAIIGGNGSGKSTLLDALGGKLFPRRGKIQKPHYEDIVMIPRDYSFHRIVGSAYQYYQQRFSSIGVEVSPTVWEILQNQVKPLGTIDDKSIALPPSTYDEDFLQNQAVRFRIDHLLQRPVVTLSNGETRRTLIAYAFLKQPKVLLLDSPFVGLDVESRELLHELLNEVSQHIQLIFVGSLADIPACTTHVLELVGEKTHRIHEKPFPENIDGDSKQLSLNQEIVHKLKSIASPFNNFETAVAFRSTTVCYNGVNVVDNVSWTVKRGERWALMGSNGSGKSTLLSLVVGDNPQAYQNDFDLFDRKRGTGESIWDIKKRTGYVSPELHLYFNRHTVVWKAVASGLFDTAGLFKTLTVAEHELVNDYLRLLNVQHLNNRLVNELSAGEQRLIFLARALIKNPPLLILDEPCQGLDFNHMVQFRELVNELVTSLDKTLIYVTHYEEEIPSCVSKRLVLRDGKQLDQ
jgi:molybdate transport system ATP-binding protein